MELNFLITTIVYLIVILILHYILKINKEIKGVLKHEIEEIELDNISVISAISLKDSYLNTETNTDSIMTTDDVSVNNSELIINMDEIDNIDTNIENELSKYLCKNGSDKSEINDYFPELKKDYHYNDKELKTHSNSLLNNNTNELYPINSSNSLLVHKSKLPINEENTNIYAFDEFNERYAPI
tara:strand:- start:3867 stop:4418 length:552 start_codon:yes stop_codon:yes gene_type:complete